MLRTNRSRSWGKVGLSEWTPFDQIRLCELLYGPFVSTDGELERIQASFSDNGAWPEVLS